MTRRDLLAAVVEGLVHFRGHGSPEGMADTWPGKAPVSGGTMRRIVDQKDDHLDGDKGDMKLMRLSGMLRVPPTTLNLVYRNDLAGIKRLQFGEPDVQQYVLDLMAQHRQLRRSGE